MLSFPGDLLLANSWSAFVTYLTVIMLLNLLGGVHVAVFEMNFEVFL